MLHKEIKSLVSFPEFKLLMRLTKESQAKRIAEIGVAYGATSMGLLGDCKELYAVDIWDNVEQYKSFISNIVDIKSEYKIVPIRLPSLEAADIFPDGFFDLVFIDADHRYSSVIADIKAWIPKVRKGGILCGHDCEEYYSHYSKEKQEEIDRNLEADETSFPCHAGVIRALYDVFNDKYFKEERIWYQTI